MVSVGGANGLGLELREIPESDRHAEVDLALLTQHPGALGALQRLVGGGANLLLVVEKPHDLVQLAGEDGLRKVRPAARLQYPRDLAQGLVEERNRYMVER